MKLLLNRCDRFSALLDLEGERELSAKQLAFMDSHRKACAHCAREERASHLSLDMLRGAVMQTETTPYFDERVLRRVKIQQVRDSVSYWSPAIVGASLAGMILFITLHLLGASPTRRSFDPGAGQARRMTQAKPSLVLDSVPTLAQ